MMTNDDTIVAQASAHGNGARGIVRLSGSNSLSAIKALFTTLDSSTLDEQGDIDSSKSRVINGWFAPWFEDAPKQKVRCVLFFWPKGHGFTGEQAVELHLPGSPPILDATIRSLCAQNGVRLANRGEFTLRSFLNGKLDLTQAEAILGAIDASSDHELKCALSQLSGTISQKFVNLRSRLLDVLSELEAGFDFTEEDIEFLSAVQAREKISELLDEINQTLKESKQNLIRDRFPRVLLLGRPNVGKSSLFNSLVDRFNGKTAGAALVAEVAGTTRDYLEAELTIHGVSFTLVDSAGVEQEILSEQSVVDHESRELAQFVLSSEIKRADLLLLCYDSTISMQELFTETVDIQSIPTLRVVTKSDSIDSSTMFRESQTESVRTSATTGRGIEKLGESIVEKLGVEMWDGEVVPATALRCQEALRETVASLHRALTLLENETLCDESLVASELRLALNQIGLVAGQTHSDDLLDRIFSRFCIGK